MTVVTIIHHPHVKVYREEPEEPYGFSGRACYALGLDGPNYPVPAIQYDVSIEADCVIVMEQGKNTKDGHWMHMHVYPDWIVHLPPYR